MLPKIFVDTNIFIHSLYKQVDEVRHQKCSQLFEKAKSGKVALWTTEWVVAELIWFLTRNKVAWSKVKEMLVSGLFATGGLQVRNKKWLMKVVEASRSGADLVDAINVSLAVEQGVKKGYSYDRGLDRYRGFKRLEP